MNGFNANEPSKEIGTHASANQQIDMILAEPDFEKHITSPRTFYKKQEEGQPKSFKSPKMESKIIGDKAGGKKNPERQILRKAQASDAQYQDAKRDRNKYSLKQIFKEKDLTFKSLEDRVELRLHQTNDFFTFEELRKRFKAMYTANPVNSKVFMDI